MGFTLNLAMFISFDLVTIALALLGFYTYPVIVAVVNVALGRETLDRPRVVALALAIAGMVAVVASQLDPAAGIRFDALGFGLALGAAASQAVFVVISKTGYQKVPAAQAMAVVMATTVVCGFALGLVTGAGEALAYPLRDPSILPLLAFTGLFAAAIPSILFLSGIRLIGGTRAGILMLFEPVVGVALAAVLLDEALAPIQVLGGVAILGAALILQRSATPGGRTVAAPAIEADELDEARRQAPRSPEPGSWALPRARGCPGSRPLMTTRIRVLIVDDHAMVRRGMRDFLDLHDDLEVVGEASDGEGALEAAETLRPDVVVMDLLMPGLDGIAATAEIKARHPAIEVVAITSFIEEDRITAAIEAGASGFLLKDAEADDLAAAIRAAHAGEVYLDPAVAGIVARRMRAGASQRASGQDGATAVDRLTGRERDVMACLARGLSNQAIATELGMAERTARTHVSNILAKLGLTSRTQAALFAVEHGLERGP